MKPTSVLLLKLEHILDNHFGHPFLKDGRVQTKFVGNALQIKIGRRDVTVDEELNVVSAGTDMTHKA